MNYSQRLYNCLMEKIGSSKGKLSIVPTPIGNLGDITFRSIETLESADAIFAEDTRMMQKLARALGINFSARIYRLDENTMAFRALDVAEMVASGKNVAYCTDAGMPGVSDPGSRLVSLFREKGLPVEVLPGASASIVAYVSSSSENPHFYFGGFLPRKDSQRRACLEELTHLDAALIFYESPNRLARTLAILAEVFPSRKVSVCRELTKLHEEVVTGLAEELATQISERDEKERIKGECVIVVDGPTSAELQKDAACAEEDALVLAQKLAADGIDSKTAVKELTSKFAISKNRAYDLFLDSKRNKDA